MAYPENFFDDMRYLRGIYRWNDDDRDEMLAWVKGDPQAVVYCQELARTWRLAETGVYQPMFAETA